MCCPRREALTSSGVNLTRVFDGWEVVMRRRVIPFWYFSRCQRVPADVALQFLG